MNTEIKISEVVWYNETPYSPELIDDTIVDLRFEYRPAKNDLGETIAVYASYKVGWPYLELYGGQFPAPVNAVAVQAATGDVHFSPVQFSRASLQQPVTLYISEAEAASGGPIQNQMVEQAFFNLDLCRLLRLPPEGGEYYVCLWLDDLVTPMQTIDVPADETRIPGYSQGISGQNIFTLGKKEGLSPNPERGEIRTDGPLAAGGNRIYGSLPPGTLENPPGAGGRAPFLSALSFGQRSRELTWYSADIFNAMQQEGSGCFDFDPSRIISSYPQPQHVFILTILGAIRSEVLLIPGFT